MEYRHETLINDETFGSVATNLCAAIEELKQAADIYMLQMEQQSEKIIAKRDKINE